MSDYENIEILDSHHHFWDLDKNYYPFLSDKIDPDFFLGNYEMIRQNYLPVDYEKDTIKDLYVRLAAGVGGAGMPAWKDTLEDNQIWALAYYVKSLMEIRNSPKRKEMMRSIEELNRSYDANSYISR